MYLVFAHTTAMPERLRMREESVWHVEHTLVSTCPKRTGVTLCTSMTSGSLVWTALLGLSLALAGRSTCLQQTTHALGEKYAHKGCDILENPRRP